MQRYQTLPITRSTNKWRSTSNYRLININKQNIERERNIKLKKKQEKWRMRGRRGWGQVGNGTDVKRRELSWPRMAWRILVALDGWMYTIRSASATINPSIALPLRAHPSSEALEELLSELPPFPPTSGGKTLAKTHHGRKENERAGW